MSETTYDHAVRVEHAYKVFGKRPKAVVDQLKAGKTREEVKDQGTAAVIDVTFDVAPGEIFVVMGLSGSGKSTLIRTLNGLQPATSGQVEIKGKDIAQLTGQQLRAIRAQDMAMVFQNFALLPHKTVIQNAAYGLEIQGTDKDKREQRAAEVLDQVGLKGWHDHYPSELSGGMQQRVGLARALAADNDILLMDEAFSALDPLIRREMQELLVELQKSLGKTIIFITHDLNEAMYLGDRIAVMKDGRIVQIGTPEQILNHPADDYVASFIADVDRGRVISAASVMRPLEEDADHDVDAAASVRDDATLQDAAQALLDSRGTVTVVDSTTGEPVGLLHSTEVLGAMVNTAELEKEDA